MSTIHLNRGREPFLASHLPGPSRFFSNCVMTVAINTFAAYSYFLTSKTPSFFKRKWLVIAAPILSIALWFFRGSKGPRPTLYDVLLQECQKHAALALGSLPSGAGISLHGIKQKQILVKPHPTNPKKILISDNSKWTEVSPAILSRKIGGLFIEIRPQPAPTPPPRPPATPPTPPSATPPTPAPAVPVAPSPTRLRTIDGPTPLEKYDPMAIYQAEGHYFSFEDRPNTFAIKLLQNEKTPAILVQSPSDNTIKHHLIRVYPCHAVGTKYDYEDCPVTLTREQFTQISNGILWKLNVESDFALSFKATNTSWVPEDLRYKQGDFAYLSTGLVK